MFKFLYILLLRMFVTDNAVEAATLVELEEQTKLMKKASKQ